MMSHDVTRRHMLSHAVTCCHAPPHAVTCCHAPPHDVTCWAACLPHRTLTAPGAFEGWSHFRLGSGSMYPAHMHPPCPHAPPPSRTHPGTLILPVSCHPWHTLPLPAPPPPVIWHTLPLPAPPRLSSLKWQPHPRPYPKTPRSPAPKPPALQPPPPCPPSSTLSWPRLRLQQPSTSTPPGCLWRSSLWGRWSPPGPTVIRT